MCVCLWVHVYVLACWCRSSCVESVAYAEECACGDTWLKDNLGFHSSRVFHLSRKGVSLTWSSAIRLLRPAHKGAPETVASAFLTSGVKSEPHCTQNYYIVSRDQSLILMLPMQALSWLGHCPSPWAVFCSHRLCGKVNVSPSAIVAYYTLPRFKAYKFSLVKITYKYTKRR